MQNFEFYNPTQIVFGAGKVEALSSLVPPAARVLMLYGGASAEKPAHWPKSGPRWGRVRSMNLAASRPIRPTKP